MERCPLGLLLVVVACSAKPSSSSEHALVAVHLDVAKPGARATLEATRSEYRGWAAQHATPPGETPVFFLGVGDEQLWALRPAADWASLPVHAAQDGQVEAKVRAAVGGALEQNDALMHGNIRAHHNELLRFQPELSRGDAALGALLPSLSGVTIDHVIPALDEAYEAALRAAPTAGGGWHLVFFSSPGSGAYVHLFSGAVDLPDARLVSGRETFDARLLPRLSSPR